jgi:mannose-6-phosphate isomerase-like protein (cupin superfamily)
VLQLVDVRLRQQVRPCRQDLPELDVRRAELDQSLLERPRLGPDIALDSGLIREGGALEVEEALPVGEIAQAILNNLIVEMRRGSCFGDRIMRVKAESMPTTSGPIAGTVDIYECLRKRPQRNPSGKTLRARVPARSARVPITRVSKPWGYEIIWAVSDRYVKILHINAGHELSVQYHNKKDETIHLLSGEIVYRVQRNGDDVLDDVHLKVGESYRIIPGTLHQMVAVTDCDVLEVSTPELDDVVRLSDKYGREGPSAP